MKQFNQDNLINKTYFSLIFVRPRPIISEQFSIGLILMNSDNILFEVSDTKLKQLRGILSENQISTTNLFINNFKKEIELIKTKLVKYRDPLISINLENDSKINFELLNKLSKSYNNIIGFSEPNYIDMEIAQENFNKFFSKMIFDENVKITDKEKDFIILSRRFKSTIKKNVDIDVKADDLIRYFDLKNYEVPTKLDVLGMNGKLLTTQFIDFNLDIHHLNNRILPYLTLVKQSKMIEGKNFIVHNETNDSPNKKLFEDLKNEPKINLINIKEVDEIKDYISENDVRHYIES